MTLGKDIFTREDIDLSLDARRRGVYIIGKPGSGKSVLLERMAHGDAAEGRGFTFLDPHGDTAERIVDSSPSNRFWHDVTYWEPYDRDHIIGFNPLKDIEPGKRSVAAQQVFAAIMHAFPKGGDRNFYDEKEEQILRNALRLLMDNKDTSLIDLQNVLLDENYRTHLLAHCTDVTVRRFWTLEYAGWADKLRDEYTSGLKNKVSALVGDPVLRGILGVTGDGYCINPRQIMDEGKILVVNLSIGRLGAQTSSVLGALITARYLQAAYSREDLPEDQRVDHTLYVDEFEKFITPAFVDILSEARKYRLAPVLAHQFLSQVPDYLRHAVKGTASTIVAFRCGAEDATLLAPEFGLHAPVLLTDDPSRLYCDEGLHAAHVLTTTPSGQAWLKTITGREVGKPIQIETQDRMEGRGHLEAVRHLTWHRISPARA